MQVYQYKLDVADARYETVKNGFKFERNGSSFTEVMNRETKKSYLLASLADGKGGVKYDIMSFDNWAVIRHNADFIAAGCKAFSEGAKARVEANKAKAVEQAKVLKGVGLKPTMIQAILMDEGVDKAEAEAIVKSL